MNFDFSSISSLLNSLSDDEKENITEMARNMMNNMQQPSQDDAEELVEEASLFDGLGVDEVKYSELKGKILDQMEEAYELESYYDDDPDSDYSAPLLFYSKAYLTALKEYVYPVYEEVKDLSSFPKAEQTDLYSYVLPLNESGMEDLVGAGYLTMEDWQQVSMLCMQAFVLLKKAESESVTFDELQAFKQELFSNDLLVKLHNIKQTS